MEKGVWPVFPQYRGCWFHPVTWEMESLGVSARWSCMVGSTKNITLHSLQSTLNSIQQRPQGGTFPDWGLGIALQVSDHQDCQSWLHHDVLFLCSDLPWRKQIPNSAEITGSSKALARNRGLIQTHLEEQMTLTWVYQCWWHL